MSEPVRGMLQVYEDEFGNCTEEFIAPDPVESGPDSPAKKRSKAQGFPLGKRDIVARSKVDPAPLPVGIDLNSFLIKHRFRGDDENPRPFNYTSCTGFPAGGKYFVSSSEHPMLMALCYFSGAAVSIQEQCPTRMSRLFFDIDCKRDGGYLDFMDLYPIFMRVIHKFYPRERLDCLVGECNRYLEEGEYKSSYLVIFPFIHQVLGVHQQVAAHIRAELKTEYPSEDAIVDLAVYRIGQARLFFTGKAKKNKTKDGERPTHTVSRKRQLYAFIDGNGNILPRVDARMIFPLMTIQSYLNEAAATPIVGIDAKSLALAKSPSASTDVDPSAPVYKYLMGATYPGQPPSRLITRIRRDGNVFYVSIETCPWKAMREELYNSNGIIPACMPQCTHEGGGHTYVVNSAGFTARPAYCFAEACRSGKYAVECLFTPHVANAWTELFPLDDHNIDEAGLIQKFTALNQTMLTTAKVDNPLVALTLQQNALEETINYLNRFLCVVRDIPTPTVVERRYRDVNDPLDYKYIIRKKSQFTDAHPTLTISWLEYDHQKEKFHSVKKNIVTNLWWSHVSRRVVESIVFDPDLPPGFSGVNLNFFKGMRITPDIAAAYRQANPDELPRLEFWKQHIRHIWCQDNPRLYNYVFGWFALALQQPKTRIGVSLVLKAAQGAGKGIIMDSIRQIYGENHYVQVTDVEQILGKFVPMFMANVLMVFLDECNIGYNRHMFGKLNAMITETKTKIEPKGQDYFEVDNYRSMVMASNSDIATLASDHARRFLVLAVSNEKAGVLTPELRQYFDQLAAVPAELVADFLYNIDVSDFNYRDCPRTDELFEEQAALMGPIQSWWVHTLERGHFGTVSTLNNDGRVVQRELLWEPDIPLKMLYNAMKESAPDLRYRAGLRTFLSKLFHYCPKENIRIKTIGAEEYFTFPTVYVCRRLYDAAAGAHEWPRLENADDDGPGARAHRPPPRAQDADGWVAQCRGAMGSSVSSAVSSSSSSSAAAAASSTPDDDDVQILNQVPGNMNEM